jgi:hypothetical protein
MEFKWKETPQMNYLYRESDGRILGAVWHTALSTAFYSAKIYTETFPFTNECEKYLGYFINEGAAKRSVEAYWMKQANTLEYDGIVPE